MRARVSVVFALALAFAVEAAVQEVGPTQTPEDAFQADARYIADTFGVPLAEAVRRLKLSTQ